MLPPYLLGCFPSRAWLGGERNGALIVEHSQCAGHFHSTGGFVWKKVGSMGRRKKDPRRTQNTEDQGGIA
jgi:hypothetical protein